MARMSWMLDVENTIDVCLIVNGKKISEFLKAEGKSNLGVSSSEVLNIEDAGGENVKFELHKKASLILSCGKLQRSNLFGKIIDSKESLLQFWADVKTFLKPDDIQNKKQDEDENDDDDQLVINVGDTGMSEIIKLNAATLQAQHRTDEGDSELFLAVEDENKFDDQLIIISADNIRSNESALTDSKENEQISNEKHKTAEKHSHTQEQKSLHEGSENIHPYNNGVTNREEIFKSVQNKSVGRFVLDIFKLKDPPSEFKVRGRDERFVQLLSSRMVDKKEISMDNAANVIGMVPVDKSEFKEELIELYDIYVIDGNHNIHAQQEAFKKTNDVIFQYRVVHLYCNLSQEEALLLGTSRNEDSSTVLKVTDFEKVDLVRRYLYSSVGLASYEEPPEPIESFTEMYKLLLNLKTKKEVDAKAIIRFLATKLSRRNYRLYQSICRRIQSTPASKFECLRGIQEDIMHNLLSKLFESNLTKNDWREFKENCLKAKAKKVVQKTTVEIQLNGIHAQFQMGNRFTIKDCISVVFNSSKKKETKVMTITELENLVFGNNEKDNVVTSTKTTKSSGKRHRPTNSIFGTKRSKISNIAYIVPETTSDSDSLDADMDEIVLHSTFRKKHKCNASTSANGSSISLSSQSKGTRNIYSFSSESSSPMKDLQITKPNAVTNKTDLQRTEVNTDNAKTNENDTELTSSQDENVESDLQRTEVNTDNAKTNENNTELTSSQNENVESDLQRTEVNKDNTKTNKKDTELTSSQNENVESDLQRTEVNKDNAKTNENDTELTSSQNENVESDLQRTEVNKDNTKTNKKDTELTSSQNENVESDLQRTEVNKDNAKTNENDTELTSSQNENVESDLQRTEINKDNAKANENDTELTSSQNENVESDLQRTEVNKDNAKTNENAKVTACKVHLKELSEEEIAKYCKN